jgi:hypothetical protein
VQRVHCYDDCARFACSLADEGQRFVDDLVGEVHALAA